MTKMGCQVASSMAHGAIVAAIDDEGDSGHWERDK
jgi:hypothetical protein